MSRNKAQHILEDGGMIDAYKYLIENLCKNGLPSGSLYEYSSELIKNYEKEWKKKKSKMLNEKIEKHFDNGMKQVEFPKGNLQYTYPDGKEEIFYPNGNKQIVDNNGIITLEYKNGMKEIKYPNGKEFVVYPDGTKTEIVED